MGHDHNHSHEHSHNHDHGGHHHEHTHEHEHGHIHKHDHEHEHENSHNDTEISKDEKTLRILLVHWVNHNQSHEKDFREWIEKAKNMDKQEVANFIEKAIEHLDKANEMLIEAKKHM